MASPVIAWLTDFGTRDHYVGTMKGVALSIAPDARFIDITHELAPQDVIGGALELAAACRYFPPGTIFVAVVDPGVGTARRAIAAKAGDYAFVAPDNGLLTLALRELGAAVTVVELTNPRFALPAVSRTFEGRDRFAPAAAWLSRGVTLDSLGPAVTDLTRLEMPEPRVASDHLFGDVLRIDRFGNALTNISRRTLETWRNGQTVNVAAGSAPAVRLVSTYGEVAPGTPCALFGSSEHLEVAIANGSAASDLGLAPGSIVALHRTPTGEGATA